VATGIAAEIGHEIDQRKVHVIMTTEITRELEALANGIGGI